MRPRIEVARLELAVAVRGLGEAHELRLLAVGLPVDGHAPAGVVVLGLLDQRVLRVQQLVLDRDRLGGNASEDPAHVASLRGRDRCCSACFRAEHERTEANLVGAPAQAVCARATGWGRAEPPAGAARRRDRVAEGVRRPHGDLDDEDAAQPGGVRRGGPRLGPRPGGGGRGRRRPGPGGPAPQAPPRGRGRHPRQPPHGLRRRGLRGVPRGRATASRSRRAWRARPRPASTPSR